MEIEKYIKDGKVAVLISYGYGAGWSTWNSEYKEFLIFDKGLVEIAINGGDLNEYLKSKKIDIYTGGWRGITIEWLEKGTQFTIDEYDGYESLITQPALHYTA